MVDNNTHNDEPAPSAPRKRLRLFGRKAKPAAAQASPAAPTPTRSSPLQEPMTDPTLPQPEQTTAEGATADRKSVV